MSVSWADRLYLTINPYNLDGLIKELRKRKPSAEALKAAAHALELVKELLEE